MILLPSEPLVAPSILAADAARLGEQVLEVAHAGARAIHVDVMDGHFVPSITFGAQTVAALRETLDGLDVMLDVHLLVERPEQLVTELAAAGADVITVHVEATPHLHYALDTIHGAGCLAGAALCPATSPKVLDEVADMLDLALCMSANLGWDGQPFITASPGKLRRLAEVVGRQTRIAADGGIDRVTGPICADAGANVLVAGSSVFGARSPGAAFLELVRAVAPIPVAETELA